MKEQQKWKSYFLHKNGNKQEDKIDKEKAAKKIHKKGNLTKALGFQKAEKL